MFNWADYAVIGVITFSGLVSLIRGFVREAISLGAWILAVWSAFHFANTMAAVIAPYVKSATLRTPIASFILLIAVLLIGGLVNFIIGTLVDKTGLSSTDRVIGMVFGTGRGVLLVAVLLLLAQLTPMPQSLWWQKSVLIPKFQPLEAWLKSLVPASIDKNNRFVLSTKDQ
jgi:membrane protein required for colicin V production